MRYLLLLGFSLWLVYVFYRDGKERPAVSSSIWIVVAWVFIHGTRPLSVWLGLEGQTSRDEGNTAEALFNLILILAGFVVLWRRSVQVPLVFRHNKWLVMFYLFWLMSIMWSDYPIITLKRLFKELGNIAMVLMVLTDREPNEAIKAVCVRLTYVCIPLSILLYRYFPQVGRAYVGYHADIQSFIGVATNKNSLGILALVGALSLLWDILDLRARFRTAKKRGTYVMRAVVLSMCWYLLLVVNSVTSLICAILGSAVLVALSIPSISQRPGRVEKWGSAVLVPMLLLDAVINLKDTLLMSMGRNATLTTRTDVWPILLSFQDSPLIGAGFDTFWAGERLRVLAEKVGDIIQAHNGYLETYLNGGSIGLILLTIVLLSAYFRIRKQLMAGMPESSKRYVVLLIAILHNFSEASFNKVGVLWFVTVYAIMEYSAHPPRRQRIKEINIGSKDPVAAAVIA